MKMIVNFLFLVVALFTLVCPAFAQDDKFQRAIEKALLDGERSAVKDASGKVKQIEIEYFSPKQTLEFDYEKDALSSVTLGDGRKMTILRNEKGGIDGFVFPNGKKAIFLWKKTADFDFSLPAGLKFISPDGKETIVPLNGGLKKQEGVSNFSKVAFRADDRCRNAVAAAAVAVAAAAVACSDGGLDCVTAVGAAAVAIANAADACSPENE
ncbi:MAG TPA: hypothetical protein VF571_07590 [Pyrinomonadaceae bacterium]|jgi:hypothetical protein